MLIVQISGFVPCDPRKALRLKIITEIKNNKIQNPWCRKIFKKNFNRKMPSSNDDRIQNCIDERLF